jgi:hypothetical protein
MSKDIRPTPTQIKEAIGDWGLFEAMHGYGIFESKSGVLYIARIDAMGVFDGDGDAVRRARKDGFRLLPSKLYKRIPKSFTDSECVLPNTWLDTPSNRRMIETLREQKKAYGER